MLNEIRKRKSQLIFNTRLQPNFHALINSSGFTYFIEKIGRLIKKKWISRGKLFQPQIQGDRLSGKKLKSLLSGKDG